MRKLALLLIAFVIVPAALAGQTTDALLASAWPYEPYGGLHDLGAGVAVVFSPDLSVRNNCNFYRALGFVCFAEADWARVIDGIRNYNAETPERPVRTIVLETHGTNGNGLKLQQSYDPAAERSYISVGALQERLEPLGVRFVIISACNSGRLLRSSIYRNLDPDPGDRLFLPATCGILGASSRFDPARNGVQIITPASSHIEMTVVGSVDELPSRTRRALERAAWLAGVYLPREFAISDVMMQILTRDPNLALTTDGTVDRLSRVRSPEDASERLFKAFKARLTSLAKRDALLEAANQSQHPVGGK